MRSVARGKSTCLKVRYGRRVNADIRYERDAQVMSAPEVYSIAQTPITCHAFNADHSRTLPSRYPSSAHRCHMAAEVALSLNDNKSQIYVKEGKEWVPTETLAEVCRTRFPQRT